MPGAHGGPPPAAAGVPAPRPTVLSTRLRPEPTAVRRARQFVRAGLDPAGQPANPATDSAVLMVSELVTNAIRHGSGPVHVELEVDTGVVRVGVTDESAARPVPRDAAADAESGRGMLLVSSLADRWGSDPWPPGKKVWFELGRLLGARSAG